MPFDNQSLLPEEMSAMRKRDEEIKGFVSQYKEDILRFYPELSTDKFALEHVFSFFYDLKKVTGMTPAAYAQHLSDHGVDTVQEEKDLLPSSLHHSFDAAQQAVSRALVTSHKQMGYGAIPQKDNLPALDSRLSSPVVFAPTAVGGAATLSMLIDGQARHFSIPAVQYEALQRGTMDIHSYANAMLAYHDLSLKPIGQQQNQEVLDPRITHAFVLPNPPRDGGATVFMDIDGQSQRFEIAQESYDQLRGGQFSENALCNKILELHDHAQLTMSASYEMSSTESMAQDNEYSRGQGR